MAREGLGVLSGKDGSVWVDGKRLALVLWWEWTQRVFHKAYATNDTGGVWGRLPGAHDCHGRMELKTPQDGSLPVQEGQRVTVQLHVDATGQHYYEVPVLIERISRRVDIATGQILGCVVDFVGTGPAAESWEER